LQEWFETGQNWYFKAVMQRTFSLWARPSPAFVIGSHRCIKPSCCSSPTSLLSFPYSSLHPCSATLCKSFCRLSAPAYTAPCVPFCLPLGSEKARGGKEGLWEQGRRSTKEFIVSWQGNQGAKGLPGKTEWKDAMVQRMCGN